MLCLIFLLVSSLFVCIFVNGSNGASVENVVHVKNEDELKNAINSASSKGIVIALDNDIALAEVLKIPANKDITLTSNRANDFYKLIGADGANTITVEGGGVLRLDGIIVTHANGTEGRGVYVMENGQFIMNDGEVSCNTNTYDMYVWPRNGGGVLNMGVFELYGGKISDNKDISGGGGGVCNMGGGTFKMFGGEISGNSAVGSTDGATFSSSGFGGGVYNGGVFELYGGKISNNKADGDGGGVFMNMYFESAIYGVFSMFGGTISGNTAGGNGGGVYSVQGGLLQGGTISGNIAGQNGGGVYWSNGNFDAWGVVVSGNTASKNNDVYPDGGGSSDGNGGGSSNGSSELSGSGGFGLRDVVFVCVGVAVVVVGVVVAVLLFIFNKGLNARKKRQIEIECVCGGGC